MAGEWHGRGMLCVNRPKDFSVMQQQLINQSRLSAFLFSLSSAICPFFTFCHILAMSVVITIPFCSALY
jgi:hypothetical protein